MLPLLTIVYTRNINHSCKKKTRSFAINILFNALYAQIISIFLITSVINRNMRNYVLIFNNPHHHCVCLQLCQISFIL